MTEEIIDVQVGDLIRVNGSSIFRLVSYLEEYKDVPTVSFESILTKITKTNFPGTTFECANHHPESHRDGRPPWCAACGWTDVYSIPGQELSNPEGKL